MAHVICKTCLRGFDTKMSSKCSYCSGKKTKTIKINTKKKVTKHELIKNE